MNVSCCQRLVIALMLLLLAGCGVFGSGGGGLRPLDSRLRICVIGDNTEPDGKRPIQIHLWTEDEYPCYDWTLSVNLLVKCHEVKLHVNGIMADERCSTLSGPAWADRFLDLLPGGYRLIVSGEGFSDTLGLKIEDDNIRLYGDTTAHTIPSLCLSPF